MGLHRTILAVGFAVASLASGAMPSYADDKEVGPGDVGRVVVKSDEREKNSLFAFGPPLVVGRFGPRFGDPGSDQGSARWLCESPYAQCMFDFKPRGDQEMIIVEIGRVRRALVENRSKNIAIDEKMAANLRQLHILQQH